MFAPRTATALTVALLALPAAAAADPIPDSSGGGGAASLSDRYGWGQTQAPATTTPLDLRSPDAADAARAGDIATAMEHYRRAQPPVAVATPSDDAPVWPEIAFAGVVLVATTGGVLRVRLRRARRVAA
jgi:hypothetical protein